MNIYNLVSLIGIFILMRISGAESLNASSNIFVGIESVFTIKPYLNEMTRSELCTVLTACMATVSSNVLAIYVFSLQNQFPTIAGHLVSASVLSAPAALIMSKIIVPEREVPKTLGLNISPDYDRGNNMFEAIINGAESGIKLIGGISALAPGKKGIIAKVGLRAPIAATLACFMTACVAGTFFTTNGSILLGG
ncbi:MAG: hypothetical protein HYW01_11375 [Deltaproteobacteria bacterium]|nr:hypothetical protein [Deltaproteobacteria bacterium]